jgi:Raf kinase inhibitor-like YbhB/YbcL family protein
MNAITLRAAAVAALAAIPVLLGCAGKPSAQPEPRVAGGPPGKITLTSRAFADGKPIPTKHTGDGDDVSPPLAWTGVPVGARSLALICDDRDAPGGTWVHWVVVNIPPSATGLPEAVPEGDEMANGAAHGANSFGRNGYGGPAPPSGPAHRYRFRLYALDAVMILKPGATREALDEAMLGHIMATGELTGLYGR